jgi:hypothetical protein
LIAHPEELSHDVGLAVAIGGPVLFMLGVLWFRQAIATAALTSDAGPQDPDWAPDEAPTLM